MHRSHIPLHVIKMRLLGVCFFVVVFSVLFHVVTNCSLNLIILLLLSTCYLMRFFVSTSLAVVFLRKSELLVGAVCYLFLFLKLVCGLFLLLFLDIHTYNLM